MAWHFQNRSTATLCDSSAAGCTSVFLNYRFYAILSIHCTESWVEIHLFVGMSPCFERIDPRSIHITYRAAKQNEFISKQSGCQTDSGSDKRHSTIDVLDLNLIYFFRVNVWRGEGGGGEEYIEINCIGNLCSHFCELLNARHSGTIFGLTSLQPTVPA